VEASRIWCQQGTPLEAELKPDATGWVSGSKITVDVLDGQGKTLISAQYSLQSMHTRVKVIANHSGWFTLRVAGHELPGAGAAYALTVTYTGTQELTK
jgi:hypothetical protein